MFFFQIRSYLPGLVDIPKTLVYFLQANTRVTEMNLVEQAPYRTKDKKGNDDVYHTLLKHKMINKPNHSPPPLLQDYFQITLWELRKMEGTYTITYASAEKLLVI